jgi:hypothetical protein
MTPGLTVPVVPPPVDFSEAEAKPNRGINRLAMEVAVRQATIDLREHESGVGIKLLRKLRDGALPGPSSLAEVWPILRDSRQPPESLA